MKQIIFLAYCQLYLIIVPVAQERFLDREGSKCKFCFDKKLPSISINQKYSMEVESCTFSSH